MWNHKMVFTHHAVNIYFGANMSTSQHSQHLCERSGVILIVATSRASALSLLLLITHQTLNNAVKMCYNNIHQNGLKKKNSLSSQWRAHPLYYNALDVTDWCWMKLYWIIIICCFNIQYHFVINLYNVFKQTMFPMSSCSAFGEKRGSRDWWLVLCTHQTCLQLVALLFFIIGYFLFSYVP